MADTILQHPIFVRFVLPFFLIFFIVFAILEKTSILGEKKRQINALVAFVIGLIFISFAYPVDVISNLILFLTIALVTMFVSLLIWGFSVGDSGTIQKTWIKYVLGIVITIAVVVALLWATGVGTTVSDWLFKQNWSGEFWTNITFVLAIGIALALVLKTGGGGGK